MYRKNARIYSDVGESKGFIKTGEIEGKRDTETETEWRASRGRG